LLVDNINSIQGETEPI